MKLAVASETRANAGPLEEISKLLIEGLTPPPPSEKMRPAGFAKLGDRGDGVGADPAAYARPRLN
jgi:hypothetical protein